MQTKKLRICSPLMPEGMDTATSGIPFCSVPDSGHCCANVEDVGSTLTQCLATISYNSRSFHQTLSLSSLYQINQRIAVQYHSCHVPLPLVSSSVNEAHYSDGCYTTGNCCCPPWLVCFTHAAVDFVDISMIDNKDTIRFSSACRYLVDFYGKS